MPYCFNCNAYDERMETVCSDCSVALCSKCECDDDVLCGCYGKCYSCNCHVNRGSDGWPCMDCREWLCNDCKNSSECRRCGRGGGGSGTSSSSGSGSSSGSDDDATDNETNNDTDIDVNDIDADEVNTNEVNTNEVNTNDTDANNIKCHETDVVVDG